MCVLVYLTVMLCMSVYVCVLVCLTVMLWCLCVCVSMSDSNVVYVCVCVCVSISDSSAVYVCVCVSMSDSSAVCEFTASANSSIKCLAYSPTDGSVYVVLSGGHMVICTATVTASRSPVRTECHGNGRPIHCIAVRALDTGFVHRVFSCFCHF